MTYPNVDPTQLYGTDLIQVFGPKAHRKHISKFTPAQKRAILNKIPEYVPTDDLGPRPSFFQIANKILGVLANSQALIGVDINWFTNVTKNGLVRSKSSFVNLDKCYKNNSVQRGIFLRHLVEDILFCFNPKEFQTGLGRKLSDGTFNLNDSQHRNVAAIIVGVRSVPLDYLESDYESDDITQYACVNLKSLAASDFDEQRIRVKRIQTQRKEGITTFDPADELAEAMYNIHLRHNSRFVEKRDDNIRPLECSGVGNMKKYFEDYGPEIYERAVSIIATVFSKCPLSTGNCWGVMEFIKTQIKEGCSCKDPQLMDFYIAQAIQARYSNPGRSGMHTDAKRAFASGNGKDLNIPEKEKIAAGVWKLCNNAYPKIKWAKVKHNGVNVADYLKQYKMLPPNLNMQPAKVTAQVETV